MVFRCYCNAMCMLFQCCLDTLYMCLAGAVNTCYKNAMRMLYICIMLNKKEYVICIYIYIQTCFIQIENVWL